MLLDLPSCLYSRRFLEVSTPFSPIYPMHRATIGVVEPFDVYRPIPA